MNTTKRKNTLANTKWHSAILLPIIILLITSCSQNLQKSTVEIDSPLGVYQSNTKENYRVTIFKNQRYSLCSTTQCVHGKYQSLPVKYGIILIDFFSSSLGKRIARSSHGTGNTDAFYLAMEKYRLSQPRANDLPFHLSNCNGVVCAGIGHRRNGLHFVKIGMPDDV